MWNVGHSFKFSIPKSPYAYRNVDWIDLEDAVRYAGVVAAIAPSIESARIPLEKNTIFSNRYSKYGNLIARRFNYNSFKSHSRYLSNNGTYRVKVITDISNFYDRLNLHRLESSLISADCNSKYVSCINELLLFWANRNSFGLPVGCDASRVLAEAALIPVDRALTREGITFVRYVDDYRLFARSFSEAHAFLNILIQCLDKESLFINTSKTIFFDLEKHREEVNEAKPIGRFDPVDEDAKIPERKFIKIGYITRIVKTYHFPGKDQIDKYRTMDLKELLSEALSALPENADEKARLFVRCFIYQTTRDMSDLVQIIDRYLHFLTYVVDALIKEAHRFTNDEAQEVTRQFCKLYTQHKRSPFYDLIILRLLCNKNFENLEFIRTQFKILNIKTDQIFMREFILRSMHIADRELLLEYRQLYGATSLPVRRAIFFAIDTTSKIIDGEKKAWFKQINKSEPDPYLKALAGKRLSVSRA